MKKPRDLYIITTARKRDTLDWELECAPFLLSTNQKLSTCNVKVIVDSWNNIRKYESIQDAYFIFDEQRLVGSGAWVKAFLKITKNNMWVLLTATPGDTWMDYIPVFVANGFYKNRTEFLRKHVIFSRFTKFPKVDRYIECGKLLKRKQEITVFMKYKKATIGHDEIITLPFDKDIMYKTMIKRWNVFDKKPIKDVNELCYLMRRVVNSDSSRLEMIKELLKIYPKIIVFYNFDYELEILRSLSKEVSLSEWNGHKHESIPNENSWVYLVQYIAGAEAWNCIETNCIVFYSQNYSYKTMHQAAGRIDRINTLFTDLYYYHFRSNSVIDLAIAKALKNKKKFNELRFMDM